MNLPQEPMLREPKGDDCEARADRRSIEGVVMKRAASNYPVQLRSEGMPQLGEAPAYFT